jgi:hypothetical protein
MSEGYQAPHTKKKVAKKVKNPLVREADLQERVAGVERYLTEEIEKVRKGLVTFLEAHKDFIRDHTKELDAEFSGIHLDIESSFRHDESAKNEFADIQRRLKIIESEITGIQTILVNRGFATWAADEVTQ